MVRHGGSTPSTSSTEKHHYQGVPNLRGVLVGTAVLLVRSPVVLLFSDPCRTNFAPNVHNTSERALTGVSAGMFDHGAHAFPDLHRRLRALLCRGVGVDLATDDSRGGGLAGSPDAAAAAFGAHAWEEEAPQAQLNGGSDPVVVTATHVVHHGGEGDAAGGRGGEALGPTASTLAFVGGGGDAAVVSPGKAASRGVRVRVRVYNATNTRLHGFSIRLSFGQGGEAAGMGSGGRVESAVHEVRATRFLCALIPVSFREVSEILLCCTSCVFTRSTCLLCVGSLRWRFGRTLFFSFGRVGLSRLRDPLRVFFCFFLRLYGVQLRWRLIRRQQNQKGR